MTTQSGGQAQTSNQQPPSLQRSISAPAPSAARNTQVQLSQAAVESHQHQTNCGGTNHVGLTRSMSRTDAVKE